MQEPPAGSFQTVKGTSEKAAQTFLKKKDLERNIADKLQKPPRSKQPPTEKMFSFGAGLRWRGRGRSPLPLNIPPGALEDLTVGIRLVPACVDRSGLLGGGPSPPHPPQPRPGTSHARQDRGGGEGTSSREAAQADG